MPSFAPTTREVFFLGGLLVFLVTFSATWKPNTLDVSVPANLRSAVLSGGQVEQDTSVVTYDSQFSMQALHAPLAWGKGEVPLTEVVAHVPGEHHGH